MSTINVGLDWSSRYSTPLTNVFSRAHKLELEHKVEIALLEALGECGLAPVEAAVEAREAVSSGRVTLERTLEIEKDTQHDIMAVVKAITEQCPRFGGFVHYGATSQDVNDTVLALQMGECRAQLLTTTRGVRRELTRLSNTYKDLTSIGRTHGQHAIPITMGFKFANFLYEISVAEEMLERVKLLGKFSGAVGTFASLGTKSVQDSIMKRLGIEAAPISTQVVSRLHMLDFFFALSAIAAALERLAKEVRNLQRTEINELHEGFGDKQVGSSTMPQKRNPHKSERICGIARIVRSQLGPALETVTLEHERDLTNSSTERVSLPTAACLCHYMLMEMEKVLKALKVDEDAVKVNLYAGGGKQLAERIMLSLAGKIGRQRAHEVLRLHASAPDFVAALKGDQVVTSALSAAELDDLLKPETYIGLAPQIVIRVLDTFGVQ
jgi:adenylosuccinate lyase